MSFNNGPVFTIGETQTYVSPTVVPWGQNDFLVFHTGVDGNIYNTAVFNDGSHDESWNNIPGNTTNLPVSVAQMGVNSYDVYVVYRGVGNDQRVWGVWYDAEGEDEGWSAPENIDGGLSITAPSVAYNPASNLLFVAVQGTDNNLYMTHQVLGGDIWQTWASQNITTYDTPHMAVNSDGELAISILTGNAQPKYAIYDQWGGLLLGWDGDTTGWQSPYSVQLTAAGPIVYSLLTGFDGLGYWKQLFDPGP